MAFISDSWLIDLLFAMFLVILSLYLYVASYFNYWKDKNVPHLKPLDCYKTSFYTMLRIKSNAELFQVMYNTKPGERFLGFYQLSKPALLVRDPQLIERILIKDFSHFEDRGLPMDTDKEPLTVNLVNLKGNRWRALRHKLTPTFTSGKLKGMFQQICNCGEDLLEVIRGYSKTGEIVNTKELCFLFSSDVIASCAFGLQIKANSPEGKQFRSMVNKATGDASVNRFIFRFMLPKLSRFLGINIVPPDVAEYFTSISKASIENRKKNNVYREDFLQLLLGLQTHDNIGKAPELKTDLIDQEDIQLKYLDKPPPINNNLRQNGFCYPNLEMTDELIAAQSFIFLAAGSDSTATTISVALHFIASHTEVQSRLQAELDDVITRHGGLWTYQAIKDMTYLDQVIQESMRIFPIAHLIMRVCTTPYNIPDTDVLIEKDTQLIIPVHSIHMDPTYFEKPQTFDPDRFYGNNFKPSATYLPFGDGPRICIAMRFAILEMKVMIARMMSKYNINSTAKTITPLQYDPKAFNNRPLGGIWVTFTERELKY